MNVTTLHSLSASRVKALFGLSPSLLADLLRVGLPERERRRAARRERRADRNRQRVANDGRPRVVRPVHKVRMPRIYLRHNVPPEVVGALFRFSADTAEKACHAVVPVLRDCCPAEKWEAEKTGRKGDPTWTPEGVDQGIIESFAAPVRRPALPDHQKRRSSGTKKRPPLKPQLAPDQEGEILTVAAGQRGPQADLKLYDEAPLPEPRMDKPRRGDTGSHSQEHPELTTPHKKPRGGEVPAEQKAENKEIARQRSVVEHAIRRVKGFRSLRDDYRRALGLFPMLASAVVGLIQFSRIAA
jgi:DDE superfamily endonuclease